MKKIILYLLVSSCFTSATHAYEIEDLLDNIWVHKMWYNHTTGSYSSDAITVKEDADTEIIAPEWINGWQNKGVAYVRNTQADLKATIRKYDPMPITSASIKPITSIGTFDYETVTYSGGAEDSTVTFDNTSGSIQNSVGVFIMRIGWYCDEINGQTVNPPAKIDSTIKTCYVVLDEPEEPMDKPWVDVLNYACDWAEGETTASGVVSDLTRELWDYDNAEYDPNGDNFLHPISGFNLTLFLSSIQSPENYLDCTAYANFLGIIGTSQGIECKTGYIDEDDGGNNGPTEYRIDTNLLYPAGGSPDTVYDWGYHVITYTYFPSRTVADASSKIYVDDQYVFSEGDYTLSGYCDILTVDDIWDGSPMSIAVR